MLRRGREARAERGGAHEHRPRRPRRHGPQHEVRPPLRAAGPRAGGGQLPQAARRARGHERGRLRRDGAHRGQLRRRVLPRVQREGRQHQRLARLAGRALQPRPGHAQRPHGGGALRRADAADHAGVRLQEDARGKDDKALPGLRQGVLQRRPGGRDLRRRVRAGA